MSNPIYTTHISRWTYDNETKANNFDNYIRSTFPQYRDCVFYVSLDVGLNRYRIEFHKAEPEKQPVEQQINAPLGDGRDIKAEMKAKVAEISKMKEQDLHKHHLIVTSKPFSMESRSGPSPKCTEGIQKLAELKVIHTELTRYKAPWEDQAVIDAIFGPDPTKYSPNAINRMRLFGTVVEFQQPRLGN